MMRTLIVGCLEGHMTTLAKMLMTRGFQISHVADHLSGVNLLGHENGADLIFCDIAQDVLKLLTTLRGKNIKALVVVCGEEAVDSKRVGAALKAGAREYLSLPPNWDRVADLIATLESKDAGPFYQDENCKKAFTLADQVAKSEAPVLITGESGTGKEVMARYLHKKSARASQAFVAVNCAAIPDNLLESELFGYEKGAFTGALNRRIGKFEEAHGGTLLLDEVTEMHPRLQAKLLRAIQEREIDRVGGRTPLKVDIRICATSNRDILKSVHDQTFRADLYFRLNVVNIHMPPLRERLADIVGLAELFLENFSHGNKGLSKRLSKKARSALLEHNWPGNVRELENTMHRAFLLSPGEKIEPDHLGLNPALSLLTQSCDSPSLVGHTVSEIVKRLIVQTFEYCQGDHDKTARLLGLSPEVLSKKLHQYGTDLDFQYP